MKRFLLPVLAFASAGLVSGCATLKKPATSYIAVMGAYAPELAANRSVLTGTNAPLHTTVINGVRFEHHRVEGRDLRRDLISDRVATVTRRRAFGEASVKRRRRPIG